MCVHVCYVGEKEEEEEGEGGKKKNTKPRVSFMTRADLQDLADGQESELRFSEQTCGLGRTQAGWRRSAASDHLATVFDFQESSFYPRETNKNGALLV